VLLTLPLNKLVEQGSAGWGERIPFARLRHGRLTTPVGDQPDA